MSISRQSLLYSLDTLLQPEKFKDYGPNGLQVEGKEPVSLLVSGVTASLALIDAAIEAQADAILVHHGLFWRGQDGRVTGWMKQRLQRLLAHDINLFAYHLPLDAHPALGNNARLGEQLGWEVDAHFGDQDLGCLAHVQYAGSAELCAQVGRVLGREPVCVPGHTGPVTRVGWCTGGAQGYLESAAAAEHTGAADVAVRIPERYRRFLVHLHPVLLGPLVGDSKGDRVGQEGDEQVLVSGEVEPLLGGGRGQ